MKTAYIRPTQFQPSSYMDITIYEDKELLMAVNCISISEAYRTARIEKAEIIEEGNQMNEKLQKLYDELITIAATFEAERDTENQERINEAIDNLAVVISNLKDA